MRLTRSAAVPNFWFNIDWLWLEKLPDSQLVLAKIMLSIEELPAEIKDTYQAMYKLLAGKN